MVYLVYSMVYLTVFLMILGIYLLFSGRREVLERLEIIKAQNEGGNDDDQLKLPFMDRVIKPFFRDFGNNLGKLAPIEIRNQIDKTLLNAGNPWNITTNNFILFQLIVGIIFALFPLLPVLIFGGDINSGILLFVTLFALGVYLPYFSVKLKATARQADLTKTLPDFLDMMFVSVEAGLAFDMALKRVTEQMPGDLSREFARAMEETRMGKTREDALKGVVRRTGVPDVRTFVNAIIQAEQMGSNIAKTLRIQSDALRVKRRQRAEETSMKAPVKLLFPMIFFIFPALFVVILGPALIKIMDMFSSMF